MYTLLTTQGGVAHVYTPWHVLACSYSKMKITTRNVPLNFFFPFPVTENPETAEEMDRTDATFFRPSQPSSSGGLLPL